MFLVLTLDLLLLALGLLGHVLLWVAVVNHVHAWGIRRWLIDGVTVGSFLLLAGLPLVIAADFWTTGWTASPVPPRRQASLAYLAGGVVVLAGNLVARVRFHRGDRRGLAVASNHTEVIDATKRVTQPLCSSGMPAWYARLPGNELFQVHVHHKQLVLPRLSPRLQGLRIAHISDLHMSGRLTRPYFEEVVRITNELEPDLIAVTGDLFDRQSCFEWIDATYARLAAPLGVYFVLGNHDVRVDAREAVRLLESGGLCHLGGKWLRVTVRDVPFLLAGNELPWFPPAPDLADCPSSFDGERPFRLVLSHSPDQFRWAQAGNVDLILAGHNHGGQIRLPLWGALFAPSRHGTRYDMGTFQQGETVMHVSRGTGTHTPVRYNCPPEIALLELRGK